MTDNLPDWLNLAALIQSLLSDIDEDFEVEGCEGPAMDVTVGWDPKDGTWSYQTGDNSFTGSAYLYPVWAVTTLALLPEDERNREAASQADYLIEQLEEYDATVDG